MTYRVFLSSTGDDLQDYRDAAYEAIRMTGASCVRMEDFAADPRTPADVCAAEVAASDMLIGLIGFHFGGRVPPSKELSFTQLEIETAKSDDKPVPSYFYVAPPNTVPATDQSGTDLDAQRGLRDRLLADHTVGRPEHWESPYRLALQVMSIVFKAMPEVPDKDKYAARLEIEVLDRDQRASNADDETQAALLKEKAELEQKLRNVDSSFSQAQARIAELEDLIDREGNELGAERIDRAEAALRDGDFDAADRLLAEIGSDEELAVQRAARAAYGRGVVAEEQVRWHDAAAHYDKAARLDPNYDRLIKARKYHWLAGNFPRAEAMGTELIRAAIDENGENSKQHAAALNNHALTLSDTGRWDEAEPLFRQAIDIGKNTIGEAHPNYAIRLNNMANLLRDMGRLEEAEPLYRQAIDIGKDTIGEAHPNYATRLNNLANLLADRVKLGEAELLYRQAIDIDKDTIGEKHPEYAARLNNLALLLQDMGRLEEAEPLYQQAIDIGKDTIGEAHPEYAKSLNNLAVLVEQLGRFDEAKAFYDQAIEIDLTALGTDHPQTKNHANNYAGLLRDHFPNDPALADLQDTFGPDIGTDEP